MMRFWPMLFLAVLVIAAVGLVSLMVVTVPVEQTTAEKDVTSAIQP